MERLPKITDLQVEILLEKFSNDDGPLLSALQELQQLRAAKAADRERVRDAVERIAAHELGPNSPSRGWDTVAHAIASRVADALAVPVRQALSDADRRTLEWLRGVMAYTADGDSGGMAARANATIDRLLSASPAPPRPSLSDTDRRHLVALRSFIAGIDGQRGHGNDWSAELALLDRLLGVLP